MSSSLLLRLSGVTGVSAGAVRVGRTRRVFVDRVRQMGDTVGATTDWPADFVLNLGATVLLDEWIRVLDVAPYRRTAVRTVTVTDNAFPWTALHNTEAPDTDDRTFAHRILEVRCGERTLRPVDAMDVATLGDLSLHGPASAYAVDGDMVRIVGATNGQAVTVKVNHTPQLLDALSSDDSIVPWIEGYEPILWAETAALMLLKGGRETQAAVDLRRFAEDLRQRLLAKESRATAGPRTMRARDDASEWGG